MAVQAWFARGDIEVVPGTSGVVQLTVVNLGDTTDTFALLPIGMAAAWTTLRPATVTLFGGSQEVIDVEVHPPLLPSTAAGATSLTVRIVPQSDPDDATNAETTLVVSSSHDRRLVVLQPALRARRRASYEMMLENRGNSQASCRMRLIDPSGRVEGDFDPPAVGVEPGATALVRMKLKANRLQWERRARSVPFRLEADQSGAPTATANATFVQAPVVPERLWSRLLGLLVAATLLGIAWFGLVKPEIRRVADDAVDKRVPELVPTTVPTVTVPDDRNPQTGTTVPPVTVPTSEGSTPRNARLVANVPPGQTITQSIAPSSGKVLEITDLFVQNPSFDSGTVQVMRGTDVLWTVDLSEVPGLQGTLQLVSPFVFGPGEQLVFQVTCIDPGDKTLAACNPALLVSGREVEP